MIFAAKEMEAIRDRMAAVARKDDPILKGAYHSPSAIE